MIIDLDLDRIFYIDFSRFFFNDFDFDNQNNLKKQFREDEKKRSEDLIT